MRTLLLSLTLILGSAETLLAQSQYGVDIASYTPTTSSPGFVFGWPDYASQNFLYDGQYLNLYGFGFHGFDDGTSIAGGGINAYFASYFGIDLFTSGQRRLRINANGDVKIERNLVVNRSLEVESNIAAHGDVEIGRGDGQDTKLRFHNHNAGWYSMGRDVSDGKFKINSGENLGDDNQFAMDWNGNVGIGTGNISDRLTVNGKIKCEELQVIVDVADYVFEQGYKLQPLEEVEAYIKENKHLPGVPGKAEVDANGFQVGQMTNKVLEKVEELTLYLIELKKENEAQNILIKEQAQLIKELRDRLDNE